MLLTVSLSTAKTGSPRLVRVVRVWDTQGIYFDFNGINDKSVSLCRYCSNSVQRGKPLWIAESKDKRHSLLRRAHMKEEPRKGDRFDNKGPHELRSGVGVRNQEVLHVPRHEERGSKEMKTSYPTVTLPNSQKGRYRELGLGLFFFAGPIPA